MIAIKEKELYGEEMPKPKEAKMSKELALVPTKEEFEIIQMMAKTAADSKHFEKIGGFPGLFSIALYAREMGIPAMTALHGGLVPVMGKITMSAEMMNSLIRQKGHKLEIIESTDKVCRIKGTRKDTGESYTCQFSIEDARKANLVKGGGGYEKHAEDMLFARCISKLKRRLFPDVATKSYVTGEIEDAEVTSSETIEVKADENTGEVQESPKVYMTREHIDEIEDILGKESEYYSCIFEFYKVASLTQIEDRKFDVILRNSKTWIKKQERDKKNTVTITGNCPSVFELGIENLKAQDLPI